MTGIKVKMSSEQARRFAEIIVQDIAEFVSANREEYEEFVKAEAVEGREW